MNCPNCGALLLPQSQTCPSCQALIITTTQVTAAERGVAAGGDINAPVFTGDINAPVSIQYTALAPIPEPPPPDRPPLTSAFIGREQELAYFGQKLAAAHLAVISGIAGAGKTSLAAALARQSSSLEKIFWYTFHADEGIDAILWRLAAFLAGQGQPGPWRTLNRARNIPREEIFRYLIQAIRGRGFLLCLDDFQHVDDDPLIGELVDELRAAVAAGDIQLILTTRRMPAFVIDNQFDTLEGLRLEDAARLAQARGVDLAPGLLERVHAATGGNPELLLLALQALQSSRDPDALAGSLDEAQDIERFLLDEVDRGLTDPERDLLSAAAALLGYPATREILEVMLDTGVRRPLSDLLRSHLLEAAEGSSGGVEYRLHAMLQSFYYDTLGLGQKQALHLRAAAYYETQQPDLFRAALHYERGGEPAKTAALASTGLDALVNQGQARALTRLLERLPAQALEPLPAAQAALALGELYAFLGDDEKAEAAFQKAWSAVEALPEGAAARALRARACHSLAAFLEFEDPQAALEWVKRGLEPAENAADPALNGQIAALHIRAGSVHFQLGNYDEATAALKAGLALLPSGQPSALAATGQRCLGEVAFSLGDVEQATRSVMNSLETSRALGDTFETVNALMDLGVFRHTTNDWPGGIDAFQQALELARQLGSRRQQASLELNLGAALIYIADDAAAEAHLLESIALAEESSLVMVRALALYRQADLRIRQEDWQAAGAALDRAETCAGEIEFRPALISIYAARAEVQMGEGQLGAAAASAASAAALATELGEDLEAAIAARVQARVDLAMGRAAPAADTLRCSLEQLEGQDSYEAALTREALSSALLAQGQTEAAREQACLALETFQALGAKRDLARINQRMTLYGAS